MNATLKTILRVTVVSVAATVHLTLLIAGGLYAREWLAAQDSSFAWLARLVPIATLFSFIWPLYAVIALPMAAVAMRKHIEKRRTERSA
jgi:hypothetical protein